MWTLKPKERKSELRAPEELYRQKCGRRAAALMPEEGGGARQPCQCLGEALGDRECSEQRQLHFTHRGLCAGLATAIWADLASASGYSQGPDIAPA